MYNVAIVNSESHSPNSGTSTWSGNYGWFPATGNYRLVVGCPSIAYTNGDITVTDNSFGTASAINMIVGDNKIGWMTFTTATPSQSYCYVIENRIVNSAIGSTTWTGNNNLQIRDGTSTNDHGSSVQSGNGRYNDGA